MLRAVSFTSLFYLLFYNAFLTLFQESKQLLAENTHFQLSTFKNVQQNAEETVKQFGDIQHIALLILHLITLMCYYVTIRIMILLKVVSYYFWKVSLLDFFLLLIRQLLKVALSMLRLWSLYINDLSNEIEKFPELGVKFPSKMSCHLLTDDLIVLTKFERHCT